MRSPRPKGETESVLPIPDKNAFWINNIEKDDYYAHFPRNLQELLRPTFPGVLRRVKLAVEILKFFFVEILLILCQNLTAQKLNYLNLVIYMDQTKDIDILHGLIETLLENQLPVRIGIVLAGQRRLSALFI